MTSIFEQVMGADFDRLHPMLQQRFSVGLESKTACVGTGGMHRIRRGPWWTVPFLQFGRLRNILVPDMGENVPFTVSNYPYRDPFGRETITFVREYAINGKTRRFDATMIAHDGRLIDYLGTHQHLGVELDLRVDADGGLEIWTDAQQFFLGPLSFSFPMFFSGRALLRERYDDEQEVFIVDLQVRHRLFGLLFGYDGTFTCEWLPATDAPQRLKPDHHEARIPPLQGPLKRSH